MNHKKLMGVNVVHRYFAQGMGTAFRFEPVKPCEELCRRFSLRGLSGMANLSLMGQEKYGEVNWEQQLKGAGGFDYAVYATDPLFLAYSNLDIDYKAKRVYYLSNDGSQVKGTRGDTKQSAGTGPLLHDIRGGKTYEGVKVEIKTNRFKIILEPGSTGLYKLINGQNETVEQRNCAKLQGRLCLNIEAAGYLELRNGKTVVARYYADDCLFFQPPFCILDLVYEGETKEKTALLYELEVENRQVYWKYKIYARSNGTNGRKLNDFFIVNNNEKLLQGIRFNSEALDEQEHWIVFASDQPIPMIEKGYTGIELNEKGNSEYTLIPHLPNPDIASVKKTEDRWVSDIFVYV